MPLKRVRKLDGLRGLACLFVVFSHAANAGYIFFREVPLSGRGSGQIGVVLFFYLSSYLLTSQFLQRERYDYSYLFAYFSRRFLRVLPLYFIFLAALYFFGHKLGFSLRNSLVSHFLLVHADYHLWTIAIEIKYYFILPIICYILSKSETIIGALILVAGSFLALFVRANAVEEFNCQCFSGFVHFLLLGSGVAFLVNRFNVNNIPMNQMKLFRGISILSLLGLFVVMPNVFLLLFDREIMLFYFFLFCAGGIFLYTFVNVDTFVDAFFESGIMRFLGKISYSVYLWHYPILNSIKSHQSFFLERMSFDQLVALYYLSVFFFSTLSYYLFEAFFFRFYPSFDVFKSRHPIASSQM